MNLITVESLMKNGYSVTKFDGKAYKDPVEKPTKKRNERNAVPVVRGRRAENEPEEYIYYRIWIVLQKGDERITFEEEYFDQLVFARDLREIGLILAKECGTTD